MRVEWGRMERFGGRKEEGFLATIENRRLRGNCIGIANASVWQIFVVAKV